MKGASCVKTLRYEVRKFKDEKFSVYVNGVLQGYYKPKHYGIFDAVQNGFVILSTCPKDIARNHPSAYDKDVAADIVVAFNTMGPVGGGSLPVAKVFPN